MTVDGSGNLGYTSLSNIAAASAPANLAGASIAPTAGANIASAGGGGGNTLASADAVRTTQPVGVVTRENAQDVADPAPDEYLAEARRGLPANGIATANLAVDPSFAGPIAAVTDAQFSALSGRVDTLESGLAMTNMRLEDLDQRMSGGIAAATALGSAIMLPGQRFTFGGNVATYNGEQGYAATFTGRVNDNFALGAGIAGNTGDGEIVAQAGFAFGF